MDNVLNYACQYTKLSQELVEYVIGTCPKEFTERDSKAPSIPLTRKKQVTFTDTCSTSTNNTQKHGVHQKTQPSNVQVIPSTGVSSSTRASGSKPRSNTKHNRILPAKSVNNKKVEDHPRTNKSVWTKVNRVDSSISSKHVVINSNSESVCKTCNKCLNSANHEMCVVNILSSVNATPTVKIVLNKGKQIWKPKGKLSDNSLNKTKQIWQPKGKLSDNSLNKTKQVWKATGKLFANVGYQWRPTGKKFTSGKLNCGYQWRPTGKKFALGELCPLTRLPVTCTTMSANRQDPNTNWGSEIPNPPNSTVFKCRWYRSSFGLAPSPVPATTYIPPTDKDLEILFQPMFNEYFDQSTDGEPVPTATVVNAPIVSTNTSVSTMIAQDAPSTSHSLSSSQVHPPVFPQGVAAGPTIEDTSITQADLHPSVNPVAGEPSSAQSTSGDVSLAEPNQVNQPPDHLRKWTKDHPLDNIVGNPSRPVSTRKQLASDALWCCYHTVLSKVEPKNFKMAVNEDSWFKAMQDEIHEFDRLKKLQKNPIFCISVDIRQNTYFVRAVTTLANVPSIYIQLFWNTLTHDVKTGVYSFQVNEHWLTLSDDLLWKALNVTPADSVHPFESPPAASQDETTGPSVHPEDATSTKMVRETLSHADAESGGNSEKINSETDTEILNVGSNSEQSHVALAGPNPEHMHDVFLATNYPKLHESLKHMTKEHVHLENPPSSSRTLSSMKNWLIYKDGKVRSKCENKGIVPTEMELVLEYTQQGASHEVSDHLKMEMEMEIPSVKASANSDIIFFFTSAQDGNKLLDDERLSLADDLKKAHDQNQNNIAIRWWNSNSNSCRDVAVLTARGTTFGTSFELDCSCCGLEFRVLNGYEQKSFDEERGLNCVVQTSLP
ncbi:hypothetical protein Tco_1310887 [Tanacetum coccineum]